MKTSKSDWFFFSSSEHNFKKMKKKKWFQVVSLNWWNRLSEIRTTIWSIKRKVEFAVGKTQTQTSVYRILVHRVYHELRLKPEFKIHNQIVHTGNFILQSKIAASTNLCRAKILHVYRFAPKLQKKKKVYPFLRIDKKP